MIWSVVRILPAPPRIPANREISPRLPKGPQLAGSDVGVSVSVETFSGLEAILGELSLALGIPFPGNGDPSSAETRFECRYCAIKPSI
jgi:hypothetical protein